MISLDARQRATVAIGILLIVMLMGLQFLVLPYIDFLQAAVAEREDLAFQDSKLDSLISNRSRFSVELKEYLEDHSTEGFYLQGTTTALASARMQQIVSTVVRENRAQLLSTETVAGTVEGPLAPAVVNVHFRSDPEGLLGTLYRLENGRPMLFVDNLIISALSPSIDPERDVKLDIQFEVRGYMESAP